MVRLAVCQTLRLLEARHCIRQVSCHLVDKGREMAPEQGFFESDEHYRDRTSREANERVIQDSTGSAPSQGFFEGDDHYRDRIAREASERIIQDSTGSAPRQGFFEGDDHYRDRIAREANEETIRASRGSPSRQGFFESDTAYDTRVRKEANESLVGDIAGTSPKQRWFESDYEYRRRLAHEARESIVRQGRSSPSSRSDSRGGSSRSYSYSSGSQVRTATARSGSSSTRMKRLLAFAVAAVLLGLLVRVSIPSPPAFPIALSRAEGSWGYLDWFPELDEVVVVSSSRGQMYLADSGGKESHLILDAGYGYDIESPEVSPDGRYVAYTRKTTGWEGSWCQVAVVDLSTLEERIIARGYAPCWSPDGEEIAFVSGPANGFGPDWLPSESGPTPSGPAAGSEIYTISLSGGDARLATRYGNYGKSSSMLSDPAWSPDGEEIAFVVQGIGEVWVVNLASGSSRRLSGSDDWSPQWSPDGNRIAFLRHGSWDSRTERSNKDVYLIDKNGGSPVRVTADGGDKRGLCWLPDASGIAYYIPDRGIYSREFDEPKASLICRFR